MGLGRQLLAGSILLALGSRASGGYPALGGAVGTLFLSAALLLGRLPVRIDDRAGVLTGRPLLALNRAPG